MTYQPTADEYLDVTKTLSSITELVLLDRFWTSEAQAVSGDTAQREPDRVRGLGTIVDEMDRLLGETEQLARRVAAAATRYGDQLDANFKALTDEHGPLTADQRTKVIELVNSRSSADVAAFVDAAVADVTAQLEPERRLLRDELKRISDAQPSDGDLSAEEEQALAQLAVLASLVLGPEAGVVVEAVGHLLDWLFG